MTFDVGIPGFSMLCQCGLSLKACPLDTKSEETLPPDETLVYCGMIQEFNTAKRVNIHDLGSF